MTEESGHESTTPYFTVLTDPEELIGEWLPPACPRCGGAVMWVHTTGSNTCFASPCGCRIDSSGLEDR